MKIDITKPEGNTLAALGVATKMMREAGASSEVIVALRRSVIGAPNVHAARRAITRATNGAITFYDPRESGMSEHEAAHVLDTRHSPSEDGPAF